MTWAYIIVMAVVLILGVALAPKPQGPKAAEIEDFDFPTAEEGRPIPVIFGEVDIRGSNVLWYGDLEVRAIKKRSGFSKSTVGHKYYIGWHMGLCHGPVDAVTNILVGEKQAWAGNATANTTISINQPDLFGGEKREGGISGTVAICMGGPTQTANSYLSTKLATVFPGIPIPAFRGILGLVVQKAYIGTSAYPKVWAVRARRILQGWQSGSAWYSTKAVVDTRHMNPAHIIYQCLTDSRWGMGVDTELIDEDSFEAVADKLHTENFGMSVNWNQSESIEKFIQIILDHIAGGLTLNNSTGKYELLLVRGDYDVEDLEEYDESDIIQVTDYQRQGWGETVNEVTLVYTDPKTRKDTTISQQDLANIDSQGARVPVIVQMKGIRNHDVAKTVLARELVSRVTPLSKVTFEINRRAWAVRYGGLFKLYYSPRNINGTVYRVLKVAKGTLHKNSIKIDALEDIYALGVNSSLGTPTDTPDDETPPPTPEEGPDPGNGVQSTTTTTPPGSPSDGDSYYVPPGATGDWAGHDGQYADWDETEGEWVFTDVPDGTLVYDAATGLTYQQQGGALVPFGGGSITVVDMDDTPDEVIAPVDKIQFVDCIVTNDGAQDITVKVSPLTAKGDLYTRDSSGKQRLPVGTEGLWLRARSAEATGLNWEASPPVGEGASACRAYKDATQSIPDSTLTALTWPVESFDTDAYHSTSSNTSRFTAVLAGKYIFGGSVQWDSDTAGTRALYVVVNGVTATRIAGSLLPAVAGLVQTFTVALDLAANDYVEVYAYQTSGTARTVGSTTEQITTAWITRVGVTAAPTIPRGATWVRGSGAIVVPTFDIPVRCPVKGVIVGVSVLTEGGTGSCVIDIWKDTYANFPPTSGDSICGSNKPTIVTGSKYEDTVLTGWTTTVNAGDVLRFHLDSSTTFKMIAVQVHIKETQ
jgi:hypothetical protein